MHAALVPEHAAEGPLIGMAFAVSAVCYLLSRTTGIPTSALGAAVHALTLLIEQRLIGEVARYAGAATIRVLPPLCPLAVSAADFSQGERLVERGRLASLEWLAAGGVDLPEQERFLGLHDHAADGTGGRRRDAVG